MKNKSYLKKIGLFIVVCGLGVSCTTTKSTLYEWGNYNESSYIYLKNSDDKSVTELLTTYQGIIENSEKKGKRKVAPPGIYADYGFLLIKLNRVEEGKEMLNKEILLYPESKMLIERILKLIEA
jgi:hypothetical protein